MKFANRIISAICIILSASLATLQPVWAQDSGEQMKPLEPETFTGSRIARPPEEVGEVKARRMQKTFGECVFKRRKEAALRYLQYSNWDSVDTDGFGHDFDEFGDVFSMSTCLERAMRVNQSRVQMRSNSQVLRIVLAEEAYLNAYDSAPVFSSEQPKRLPSKMIGSSRAARAWERIADCVVYEAPDQADALLRTKAASDEEFKAATRLEAAFAKCLPKDQRPQLTPTTVRAIVGNGLYALGAYEAAMKNNDGPENRQGTM